MNNQTEVGSVAITWRDKDGAARSSPATVLALDTKAIKLAVQEAPVLLQPCTIVVSSIDATPNRTVQATIHHARQREEGFQVTCELAEPLTEATAQQLASCCNIDRRLFARWPTNIEVQMRAELCAGAIPVRIVDLSEGGCCVQSPQEVPVGTRARLISWDDPDRVESITLRVRWKRPCDEGFLVGCQFAAVGDYAVLRSLIGEEPAATLEPSVRRSLIKRVFYLAFAGMSLFHTTSA